MKRSLKNIIMILIIIVMSILLIFSVNYIKSNRNINKNNSMNNMMQNNKNDNNTNGKPSMDNNSMNDNKESNNMTPPDNNDGNMTPPSNNNGNMTPPSNNNGNMTPPNDMKDINNNLDKKYYIVLGIESLLIIMPLLYLIMSRFNKYSFKYIFRNKDKLIIYILLLIILVYICILLTSKLSISSNKNNNIKYSSTITLVNKNINNGVYKSSKSDENVIIAKDNKSTITNSTINKTGDSDGGDNTSFYGNNSAILAKDKANLIIKNIKVNTNSTGSNGIFSYGGSATTNNSNSDGTKITINNSKITTNKDNSGGIMVTGGGKIKATNLKINTKGISSAAIRSDRGGGVINVNKGTYTTTGSGSPAVYSTANINIKNSKLVSKASEGLIIEGSNSINIDNCDVIDTNNKLNGKSTTYKNIFIYQSMSGDASNGTASFTSKNSNITTNKGDTIYVTNTNANINLENNKIINNDKDGNFIRIQKDSWGNNGSNGGEVKLNMTNQEVKGNIVVDSISKLNISMNKSSYEGIINSNNEGEISLKLDKKSKIKLMGDSYIKELDNEDKNNNNINFNGYKLYVNDKSIN